MAYKPWQEDGEEKMCPCAVSRAACRRRVLDVAGIASQVRVTAHVRMQSCHAPNGGAQLSNSRSQTRLVGREEGHRSLRSPQLICSGLSPRDNPGRRVPAIVMDRKLPSSEMPTRTATSSQLIFMACGNLIVPTIDIAGTPQFSVYFIRASMHHAVSSGTAQLQDWREGV